MWWNTVIDEKQLAIDLFLLPRRKRERMLSQIPESRRKVLEGYFARFESVSCGTGAVAGPALTADFNRSSNLARMLPGGSATLIRRVEKLLSGDDQTFPPGLAQALQEYCGAANEVDDVSQR
ncbi:hypothetical protein [Microbulbifer sediminum]|uniref:hypothetical protein n=1 Tax=Microbulbifer sediminum TaxID=2904250 RepID=UPI001F2AADA6|nr:hypothetical protein [Microbulbifer sediminum]